MQPLGIVDLQTDLLMKPKFLRLLVSTQFIAFASTVHAASPNWSRGAATDAWNTPGNWSTAVVPVAGDTVNFTANTASTAITLNASYQDTGTSIGLNFSHGANLEITSASVNELYVGALSVTDGFSYTLNIAKNAAQSNSGTMPLAATTWNIGNGGTLVVKNCFGAKSGVTGGNLNKTGAGTLKLGDATGVNGISQYLSLNAQAGITVLGFNSGGGNAVNGIAGIAAGATVKFTGSSTIATLLGSTSYSYQAGVTGVAGTLDLNGLNQTIASLTGPIAGVVTNAGGTDCVLTVGLGTNTGRVENAGSFAGVLADGATNRLGLSINFKDTTKSETLYNTNTYSGPTSVTAGSLNLYGGSIARSALTLAGAGRVRIGNGVGNIQTSALAGLTQGGSSAIELDLTASTNDRLAVTGDYAYSGGSIEVTAAALPSLPSTYTLVTYTGSLSGAPVVNFSGFGTAPIIKTVDYGTGSNSAITVTFSLPPAVSLTWSGAVDGNWDLATTANWLNGATASTAAINDRASFDDSAATTSVVLNAAVTPLSVSFDNSTKTYAITGSGGIGGGGTLTKSGSGRVILATDNSYTGTTTITAGTLQAGAGGTTGSPGSGAIVNDGSLVINRSNTLSLAAISGSGSLSQSGVGGTTILAADNSYSGVTTINAGTLQVGNGAATGSLGSTSAIVNNGRLVFNRSGSQTISLDISGSGSLVQSGPGTLILDNDMTYSGATTINGGTLQLGSEGTLGSVVAPAIVDNGNLIIKRSDDLAFAKNISGSGVVTHAGTSTLRLTGVNSYTGGTVVAGNGTLLLDSAGSTLPAATGFTFSGNGILDFSDLDLSLSSLTKGPAAAATVVAAAGKTLTVGGAGNILVNEGRLTLTGVDHFVYNNATGSFSTAVVTSGGSATTVLASLSNTITAATFSVGLNGPAGNGSSATASVNLGLSNVIQADSISVGSNGAQTGVSTLQIDAGVTDAAVSIRGSSGGSSRANMTVGYKNSSDYAGGSAAVDFTAAGTTLDAMLGTVIIGKHDSGAGNFNNATSGSIAFNTGTLDAINIVMAAAATVNGKTANGTLTTNGGTLKVETLTMVQDSGGAMGTAIVNLNSGATLLATAVSGQAAANAIINLNAGTLGNLAGADLTLSGVTLTLPAAAASRSLITSGGFAAAMSSTTVLASHFDSSAGTPVLGNCTLSGTLNLNAAILRVVDDAATPVALANGTKLTLLDHSGATLSGTFADIADGAVITVGVNRFVVNYNDTLGGAGHFVTLQAANATPYETWIARFTAITDPLQRLPGADPDQDGLPNLIEYVLGTSPADGTQANLPTAVRGPNGVIFTFTRDKSAIAAGYATGVEYSQSLTGTWTPATPEMFASPVDHGSTETIVVTIPAPDGASSLFARLKVVATP